MKKNAIINVLKPPGMTSSNVVSDVRRILGTKKVGHAGTLDPGAAGVLPIFVGNATRLFDYLDDDKKEYIFEVVFGTATDTIDSYGEVVARDQNLKTISKTQLQEAIMFFVGEIDQTPPMYSAIVLNGERLYAKARRGEVVDLSCKKRKITVFELEIVRQNEKNVFIIRALVSKGTYVRVLAQDIAKKLQTVCFVSLLLRTKTGCFEIEQGVSIADLQKLKEQENLDSAMIEMDSILGAYNRIEVIDSPCNLKKLSNGNKINTDQIKNFETKQQSKQINQNQIFKVYIKQIFVGFGTIQAENDETKFLNIKALLNTDFGQNNTL